MSYQRRVEEAVSTVRGAISMGIPMEAALRMITGLEMRLPENSIGRRDFISDVKKAVKVRGPSKPRIRIVGRLYPKTEGEALLTWVWSKAIQIWGECFPDGDPWDRIGPTVARKMGIELYDVTDVLDRAFKIHEGITWDKWLVSSWDQIVADSDHKTLEMWFGTIEPKNPWRSG